MAESEGEPGTAGEATETSPDGAAESDSPKRVTRREALAVLGATTVVGAGYMAGRRVLKTENASSNRDQAAPSSTSEDKSAVSTTAAPTTTTTAPPPAFAKWSDPAVWGGKVPGAGDVAKITPDGWLLIVDRTLSDPEFDRLRVLAEDLAPAAPALRSAAH